MKDTDIGQERLLQEVHRGLKDMRRKAMWISREVLVLDGAVTKAQGRSIKSKANVAGGG